MSHSVHRLTRTPVLVLLAALVAATLTACAGTAEPGTGGASPADPSSAGASAGGTSYPLTLTTPYGTTTLEAKPERVAVVGPVGDLDNVMVLGVVPVLAPKFQTSWPWLDDAAVAKIEKTYEADQSNGGSLPFETVAASNPDVIIAITDTGLEDNYDKLAKIAPVVALPDKPTSNEVDWEAALRLIGSALDRNAEAEQQITTTRELITTTAAANPAFAGQSITFAVSYGADGISYFNYGGSPAEKLLTGLGFAPGTSAAKFTADNFMVPAENLPLLDSDVLLVNFNTGADGQQALESSKLFQQLEVVKNGHYLGLLPTEPGASPLAWSLARPSALNLQWSIGELTPKLAEAVAGS